MTTVIQGLKFRYEVTTKYDPLWSRRDRRANGEAGGGKTSGRSLDTGRRNKTRKLDTRLSLSLSFLPLYSTEANHPIRFSSFHLYIDFLPSRPFFFSLGKACANLPMRAFYLSRANRTPSRIFPIVWLYPTLYSIIHRPVNFPL